MEIHFVSKDTGDYLFSVNGLLQHIPSKNETVYLEGVKYKVTDVISELHNNSEPYPISGTPVPWLYKTEEVYKIELSPLNE